MTPLLAQLILAVLLLGANMPALCAMTITPVPSILAATLLDALSSPELAMTTTCVRQTLAIPLMDVCSLILPQVVTITMLAQLTAALLPKGAGTKQ
jgi:hypothetical protein